MLYMNGWIGVSSKAYCDMLLVDMLLYSTDPTVCCLSHHVCISIYRSSLQLYSCELEITLDASPEGTTSGSLSDLNNSSDPFKGVFIRAPAILKVRRDELDN